MLTCEEGVPSSDLFEERVELVKFLNGRFRDQAPLSFNRSRNLSSHFLELFWCEERDFKEGVRDENSTDRLSLASFGDNQKKRLTYEV